MRKRFKKMLAIFMVFSMLFCNSAFATPIDVANSEMDVKTDTLDKSTGTDYFTDEENEWQDGTINEEVRVTVNLDSEFEITIPKEIVLDGEDGTAQYKVKAVGDIAGDQKLSVVPDADFVLSEAGGKTDVTATVTQPDTEYVYTDLQNDGTEYDGSIAATLTAGEWSGKFNFNINFIGETNAKLYELRYTTTNNVSTFSYIEEENAKTLKFNTLEELKDFTSNNSSLATATLTMNTNENTEQQNLSNLFKNDENLTQVDLTNIDVEKVSDVLDIFSGSNNLQKVYVKHKLLEHIEDALNKINIKDNILIIVDENNVIHDYETIITNPTCEDEGYTTYKCKYCNYNYKDDKIDATGHNYTSEVTKEASCTEKGIRTYTCSCGDTYTEDIDATGHNYTSKVVAPTHEDDGYTEYTCLNCGDTYRNEQVDATGHDYKEEITTQATCTENGLKTFTCDCGKTYEEVIQAIGHDYEKVTTNSTCTENGYDTNTCKNCGDVYTDNIVSATGHEYTSEVTIESTCTEKGVRTYTCSKCNDKYTEDIDELGHDYKITTTEATCTEQGYDLHTCTRCNDNYKDNYKEVLGHDYIDEVTVTPTCTEKGVRTYICSKCNDKYTEDIEAVGHNYVGSITIPTCVDAGYTTYTCSKCNDSYIDEEVPANGHDYTFNVVTTPATCETSGLIVSHCSCGDFHEEVIPATGHNLTTTTTAPTCTEQGYDTQTCSKCSYTNKINYVNATGHTEVNGGAQAIHTKCSVCGDVLSTIHSLSTEVIEEPTYTEMGKRKYICECGYNYIEDIDILPFPEIGRSLEEYSWAEIAAISESGEAANYFVIGDTKTMTLSNGETYNAEIIGFNHDNLADGSGTAGITFQFKELMTTTHNMNSTLTNIGGWEASEMRTYVNNDVFALLPSELQAEIKIVDKVSDAGNKDTSTLIHTSDKLFLLSMDEVGVSHTWNVTGQGTQYEKFTDGASRVKNLSGSAARWWLRSAYAYNADGFFCMNNSGSYNTRDANRIVGVAPAFCI